MVARDQLAARVRRVAGTDVSFDRRAPTLHAAVVVLDAETLAPLETASATREAVFPYVPGFLSFRELPVLLAAFAKLAELPDLIVCDGHGRAHPRRFGLASHLGVLLDLPTLGCAKSVLVGEHAEPGARRGAFSALRDGGETIGSALRTQAGVAPVYVSVGHRVSLASARRWVLRLAPRFRLDRARARRPRREQSRAPRGEGIARRAALRQPGCMTLRSAWLALAVAGMSAAQTRGDEGADRADERARMVAEQIAARGVKDVRVLDALRKVPRHLFVPEGERKYAYQDGPLPIGSGQTISQPYIVAAMSELARVAPGERVLEVGTGSGYQAAVLAEMGARVDSIEIVPELAESARNLLVKLGYRRECDRG